MRFSYAIVALIGAAHAMPAVGSLVTGRSVCNDASADCKSVARAVVADQAALDARQKSRQAKARQANATAAGGDDDDEEEGAGAAAGEGEGETNDKRSKNLFQAEGRAVVTDKAALDARQKSRQAKARQANATAGAGGDDDDEEEGAGAGAGAGADAGETNDKRSKNLFQTEARAVVADKAALDARQKSRQAKARQANATTAAGGDDDDEEEGAGAASGEGEGETNDKRSKNLFQVKTRDGQEVRAVTDSAAMDDRMKSREAKSAAANGTADAGAESRKSRKSRKFRKSRRSHQLW